MLDRYGRDIRYLRISVTDRCNYRCRYCMPGDGVALCSHQDILSFEEITAIADAAVSLGITKIRLTGGEPLVRRGITDLCRMLKAIPNLSELSMTTNGSLLSDKAKELKAAGLDRLNISLDTLDPGKFQQITRVGTLSDVFAGIDAAEAAGFLRTKLNVVLIGGFNDDEILDFVALTEKRSLSVRFIELMPIGVCQSWPKERFVSTDALLKAVPALVPERTDGVATEYRVPGFAGTVGLISPLSHAFCDRCNRIRLTADGRLKPCLHAKDEIFLRGLSGDALLETMQKAIYCKPAAHRMDALHPSSAGRNMFEIGG